MKRFVCLLFVFVLVPLLAFAENIHDPVGMWSFYWDTKEYNELFKGTKAEMSDDIMCYNLYLFSDGSAYMTNGSGSTDRMNFSYGALSGVWIGDQNDLTIRVKDNTFKAWIDESDRLFLKMTDSIAFLFFRIPSYDYTEGKIQ